MSADPTTGKPSSRTATKPTVAKPVALRSRIWYEFVRWVLINVTVVCWRIRCHGRERLPTSGGALLLANHQSHLDPPLIGMVVPRRVSYVARQSLFTNRMFGWFINTLDAIPIDREGLGLAGLKETMRRLKRGELVLLFPEGTRTPDGEVHALKPGFSSLVQRTGVPIIPIAIDGAFEAFPRQSLLPRTGVIHLVIGEPIDTATSAALDDRALVTLVEERIRKCHAEARSQRRRAIGGN